MRAVVEEIDGTASPEQSAGFFRAVGRRFAARYPVANAVSNTAIFTIMNSAWSTTGWGSASIAFEGPSLRIDQTGLPPPPAEMDPRRWREIVVVVVLEGAYDEWLRSLGGDGTFRTRSVAISGRNAELRYGAA